VKAGAARGVSQSPSARMICASRQEAEQFVAVVLSHGSEA